MLGNVRTVRTTVLVLALLLGLGLVPTANAALPAGTVTLATGLSTIPYRVSPNALTTTGMVFSSWDNGGVVFNVSPSGSATKLSMTKSVQACSDVVSSPAVASGSRCK